MDYFQNYMDKLLGPSLLADFLRERPDLPEEFLREYITSSFVQAVRFWMKGGMVYTPAQMADFLLTVVEPAGR